MLDYASDLCKFLACVCRTIGTQNQHVRCLGCEHSGAVVLLIDDEHAVSLGERDETGGWSVLSGEVGTDRAAISVGAIGSRAAVVVVGNIDIHPHRGQMDITFNDEIALWLWIRSEAFIASAGCQSIQSIAAANTGNIQCGNSELLRVD